MLNLTTLPLTWGQEGHGGAGRQEALNNALAFAETNRDDSTLETEHEDVFDVIHFEFVKTNLLVYFIVLPIIFQNEMINLVFYH